jgi:hypothetical protein
LFSNACLFSFIEPRTRHFDRSCSQSYREQRSGEIRFSTQPSPSHHRASAVVLFPPLAAKERVPYPWRTLRWVGM